MNFLAKLKKEDFTFRELQDMVGPVVAKNTRWLLWDELAQFKNVQELMSKKAVVILLQIETRMAPRVGHFILLLDYGDRLEHFDSYGLSFEQELAIIHEHHLTRIFKYYRKPIYNNTRKLQTFRQDINTCGRWIVARLMLRGLKLDEFLKLVSYFKTNPDDLITAMTMLLQIKT